MKKQGTREQITVDVDTTAVDTLSAELAAAVAPQAELETAPVEGLFDDEKKLEEEVALSEGAIQTEAVEVAAADNGVAAMVLADTNAQSSGGASTGGSSGGSVPTGVWIGAGVLGAAAIVAASDDDDDDNGGSKSSTPANRAPEAAASQAVSVDEGDSTVISINATDADGDSLTYSPTNPANGSLTVNGSNQFTYTPDAGFSGADSFDVVISDGKTSITQTVNITVDPAGNGGTPGAYQLTSGTDVATADVFDSSMVFTPDGSDRILSLQDEDVLTGTAGKTDNTLNVTMGNMNADEGTTGVVTPKLINIQNINIDWTGNTNTLDLRNADSTQKINVERVTQDASLTPSIFGPNLTGVTVDNISTPVADLRVSNTASDDATVAFVYKQGVLTGNDTLDIELDDVLAQMVGQSGRGTGAATEGFETVNLNAVNGVDLDAFSVNEMESLVITGSGSLKIVNLNEITSPSGVFEANGFNSGAISNPSAVGLLSLDASAFAGDMEIDISSALGGHADPSNSGAMVHTNIQGGAGNDVFWTSNTVTDTSPTNRDVLDGGAGANSLVTTAGVENDAAISNIQSLELRQQNGAQTVDFDAFDSSLTSVLMRGEQGGSAMFNLRDLGSTLAQNGVQLNHGITGASNPLVDVELKDASTGSDTFAITIEDDRNNPNPNGPNFFNFRLDVDGDNGDGNTIKDDGRVENITIIDNDIESNTVELIKSAEHNGTLTLSGGEAGDEFTVSQTLISKVVDGSAQASDLRLTVGNANQDIRLGSGDDILTFATVDGFNSADKISDQGGVDTVRAAFSKDANLDLVDIENLHIVASEKISLGMANADVDNLVIMGSNATDRTGNNNITAQKADNAAEPFVVTPETKDVITLTDTTLSELNFSADLDVDNDNTAANRSQAEAAARSASPTWTGIGSTVAGDAAYKAWINDESTQAVFNGVTLANNTGDTLAVNINSQLDDVIFGATMYELGQLTAHGVKTMNVTVADEDRTAGAPNAQTIINNIYGKNLSALTVSAQGNVDLKTISGGALNNTLKSLDATSVQGSFTADAIALGDGANVTLGRGNDKFSAATSAGKGIKIDGGNGNNDITGSAQNDTITTGSGWDTIQGGRGDNVIFSGAGNDLVQGLFGNDTYSVGTGIDTVQDNFNSGNAASTATNTVSLDGGGITSVQIDVQGDGIGVGDVDQMLAVGAGSTLTVSWTGSSLNTDSAVLDGRRAFVNDLDKDGNAAAPTANSDLFIRNDGFNQTVDGGDGNDVAIMDSGATGTLDFRGGAGNDAAIGGFGADTFNGGAGADKFAMQNFKWVDGASDTVVIADGESTAAAMDQVFGFDAWGGVGEDVLDLASTIIATNANIPAQDTNVGRAGSVSIVNGVANFSDINGNAQGVGTGAGDISLQDALGYLAANLNNTGSTVAFTYDADGNNSLDEKDSVFVFQDGGNDTVVELVGMPGTAALVGLEIGATDNGPGSIQIA
ncbi:MAG: Ig-like domain-containing protein [Pseudomonadota bacterium]|nr:Ig-like domain-containing protein [Pseudomonadota bacterium]